VVKARTQVELQDTGCAAPRSRGPRGADRGRHRQDAPWWRTCPYCAPTPRRTRSAAPFFVPTARAPCARRGRADERAPLSSLRSPPTRSSRPRITWSARGPAGAPRCRRAASARTDRSRSAKGRSARAGPFTAPQSSASTGYRLSPCGARASARLAGRPRARAARPTLRPRR
jgi:hypothetical protein